MSIDLNSLKFVSERQIITNNTNNRNIKVKGRFFAGPISWHWLSHAAQLPGKALHVAIAIQHLSKLNRSKQIKLRRTVLKDMGVKKNSGYRASENLKNAGLIEIERHRGRCPIVTIKNDNYLI